MMREELEEGMVIQAKSLPEGWLWHHYEDGSGSLYSPSGQAFFSYDMMPYWPAGIEYRREDSSGWDIYYGSSMDDFIQMAESDISCNVLSAEENKRFPRAKIWGERDNMCPTWTQGGFANEGISGCCVV